MGTNTEPVMPIGRFAPSPTGELHLGSLTTAVASYCHIKSLNGKWLLRIEDTDTQRCKPEFSQLILHDLSALGLFWDDEIVYQSQRCELYNSYINDILRPHIYACECSRKQLKTHSLNTNTTYPQYCLDKSLDFTQHKLRIQLPNESLSFIDGIQGFQHQNPQTTLGDMVIRRGKSHESNSHEINSHNMINYILAVSIDDGLQNITHIMRGLDILPLTSAQIAIMEMAGFQRRDSHKQMNLKLIRQSELNTHNQSSHQSRILSSTPCLSNDNMLFYPNIQSNLSKPYWYHLPLVLNKQGQKLSKQNLATPIDTSTEKKCSQLIATALDFLKQPKVDIDNPQKMLNQAVQQWCNEVLKSKP